jgi:hypothetical protein
MELPKRSKMHCIFTYLAQTIKKKARGIMAYIFIVYR